MSAMVSHAQRTFPPEAQIVVCMTILMGYAPSLPPTPVCTCVFLSYENIVQIRCLYDGVSVEEMLEGWDRVLPETMKKWELDRSKVGGQRGFCMLARSHWHACMSHPC